ncbi:formin-like protein 5 [Panicum virgatum]|uniref:formin-like protein 5 n=1 Tax=Panicum virgatum TaxID=38727 RepID=UPI0019D63106|nr:formin-like protein 5 [Panicum virgatum]
MAPRAELLPRGHDGGQRVRALELRPWPRPRRRQSSALLAGPPPFFLPPSFSRDSEGRAGLPRSVPWRPRARATPSPPPLSSERRRRPNPRPPPHGRRAPPWRRRQDPGRPLPPPSPCSPRVEPGSRAAGRREPSRGAGREAGAPARSRRAPPAPPSRCGDGSPGRLRLAMPVVAPPPRHGGGTPASASMAAKAEQRLGMDAGRMSGAALGRLTVFAVPHWLSRTGVASLF